MLRATLKRLEVPSRVYEREVATGKLRADPRQQEALRHLDRLYNDVVRLKAQGIPPRDLALTPPPKGGAAATTHGGLKKRPSTNQASSSGGFFSSFLKTSGTVPSSSDATPPVAKLKRSTGITHPLSLTRGLYLHGDVGCGKTHVMDILYHELPSGVAKRRVHFHQFMQGVHKDMHAVKQVHGKHMDGNELMREVAIKQVQPAEVLCFDELVVADVADAMILRRLFENMYAVGVLAIFTSNRKPEELYKDGLNRGGFLPFIELVKERCHVHDMSSGTDHRLKGTVSDTFLFPVNAEKADQFDRQYRALIGDAPESEVRLRVYGRDVLVPRSVGGVCRFSFKELCGSDRSVADFSEIAKHYHTLFLENVPTLQAGNSDTKRRFISLLDELYQYKVKLYILADAPPDQLELKGDAGGASVHIDANEEAFYAGQLIGSGEDMFQMRRAVSRLQEMRSKEYATQRHLGHGVSAR